ncbi:aldehyde dehydrogenase molybdenum-binding subunit apoprotein [Breoghania corrubedonensis]|uniref:Aldehyde dehydrogenase molybdenum-binding subunit apoprotein n=1 Tax=Breoghania corrubedonensis TaxID=665038 RepID=A0A2T5VGG7_9HYPH|nr:molybdopterin-dependent aldehyde oxidoreductase [Breoghania corrubedonensis]PTW62853.1 aldehyde dehydrogenase molybdenum-binding subunit apoprotein [Breoghania corrubedonensis]
MKRISLNVNGVDRWVLVEPGANLADVLRNQLRLTGSKVCCDNGQCGSCTVIIDGKPVRACLKVVDELAPAAKITTIEGVGTPGNLHPLQVAWMTHGAAQCGICTSGFIMSGKALLDKNLSPTREQVRAWFNRNRNLCRCTGYKPLVDAVMDAAAVMRGEKSVAEIMPKAKEDGSILGSSYIRPSAEAKVTGTWDFGADIALRMPEGTLRLALVQATVSHAEIKGIDTSEAEAMPGVEKVLTWEDVKGRNAITGLITFPSNKGDGWDRPILCRDKIFQYGDAIAIVAADTEAHARAAAEKVKVDLEILPAYMSGFAALAPDAMEIHPGVPNAYYEQGVVKGAETAPLIDKAAAVVDITTYCSRQPHLHLEPDCGEAFVDDDGVLTILSKSIGVHLHHAMICPGLGLEPDKLRLIQNPTGGTFGYKFSPTMEALLGVAALATGKPVSLVYDQHQNITYTGKRSPVNINIRLACGDDGKLSAMETDWWLDHGPYSEFGDLVTLRQAQFTGAGYHLENIRGQGRTVATNHAWGSAFRGYGSPQAFLASEIAMDILAEKMGEDPFEFRYKNLYNETSTTPTGQKPDVLVLPQLFDMLRPKYEEAKKRCAELSTDEVKRGVGIALGIYGCGLDGPDSSNARVEMTRDGVVVYNAWEDHGQGADLGTLTMAHEVLRQAGITVDQIKLDMNDTNGPNSGPAGGSRSNVFTGNATRVAAEMLLNAMRKDDGTYRTYDEMVADNVPLVYDGNWVAAACTDCTPETGQGDPFPIYMYEVFMPEVEVEVETGEVKVVKFTTSVDVGTIINKATVDGQIYGGLAQGIGLALTEDFEDLELHNTLKDCGIPYPKDVPDEMEILYLETPRPLGPFGAAGCGEAPLTAPHPAILNAIYNACGVRIFRVPALPEVIKQELEAKAAREGTASDLVH